MDHIAPIHPTDWISFCMIGANTNCPKDPPALITPEAVPWDCAGSCCAAATISTEKLLAPAPLDANRPKDTINTNPVPTKDVIEHPSARITTPAHQAPHGP